MMVSSPRYLLLGCGYTLTRAAAMLPTGSFVVTTTSNEKAEQFKKTGYQAEVLDTMSMENIAAFLGKYPTITTVVDSVPPFVPEHGQDYAYIISTTHGVQNTVDAIRKRGNQIQRVVYLSTTGVFGVEDGSVVDEKTPPVPSNPKSKARFDSESVYRTLSCEVIALRIPGIYGPGRGLGSALKRGTYASVEGGTRWSNRIQVEDLAAIVVSVATYGGATPLPPVLCASDNTPSPITEIVEYYCTQFNFPRPRSISLEEAKHRELHTMLSNQRISNKLMKETLKLTLRYPSYKEGAATEFEK